MFLFTLALMVSQSIAAFPVRGSLWRSLDSAFVIDGDTIVVEWAGLSSFCGGYAYGLSMRTEDSARIRRFRTTGPMHSSLVTVSSKQTGSNGMMIQCSTPTATYAPADQRQFLLRGKAHVWALWADSIELDTKIPATQMHGRFKARWRWSRVDSTLPWVRWIDTLFLGSLEMAPRTKPSLHSQPVLTMIRSTSLDSVVPARTTCGSGLFLGSDTTNTPKWGYSGPYCSSGSPILNSMVPSGTIPVATTFRPVIAYNSASQGKWTLRHAGKTIDSLWMHGTATVSVFRPEGARRSPRSGNLAIEPATGRRVHLDSPLPAGRHFVSDREGTRLLVVE